MSFNWIATGLAMATIGFLSLKLKWAVRRSEWLSEKLGEKDRQLVNIREELVSMNIMYENRLHSKDNSIEALKNRILGGIDEDSYIRDDSDVELGMSEEDEATVAE